MTSIIVIYHQQQWREHKGTEERQDINYILNIAFRGCWRSYTLSYYLTSWTIAILLVLSFSHGKHWRRRDRQEGNKIFKIFSFSILFLFFLSLWLISQKCLISASNIDYSKVHIMMRWRGLLCRWWFSKSGGVSSVYCGSYLIIFMCSCFQVPQTYGHWVHFGRLVKCQRRRIV